MGRWNVLMVRRIMLIWGCSPGLCGHGIGTGRWIWVMGRRWGMTKPIHVTRRWSRVRRISTKFGRRRIRIIIWRIIGRRHCSVWFGIHWIIVHLVWSRGGRPVRVRLGSLVSTLPLLIITGATSSAVASVHLAIIFQIAPVEE